jgi:hypothetical protein
VHVYTSALQKLAINPIGMARRAAIHGAFKWLLRGVGRLVDAREI